MGYVAARDIMNAGLRAPLYMYQPVAHMGGTLANGFFMIPFAAIFRNPAIALNALSLMWSLATLALLFCFLRTFFGYLAAILACVFYIFAPMPILRYSLILDGTHYQSVSLILAVAWLFYRIIFEHRNGSIDFWWFGLLCGFSAFFSYGNFLAIAVCLCMYALSAGRPRVNLKQASVFSLSALAGLSPWAYYNFHNNWAGLLVKAEQNTGSMHFLGGISSRFRLSDVLSADFIYDGSSGVAGALPDSLSRFLSLLYYIILAAALCYALLRWRRRGAGMPKETFFILYILLFTVAFISSLFLLKWSYIIFITLSGIVLAALLVRDLWLQRGIFLKASGHCIFIVLIGVGMISMGRCVARDRPVHVRIKEPMLDNAFVQAVSRNIAWGYLRGGPESEVVRRSAYIGAPFKPLFYNLLGYYIYSAGNDVFLHSGPDKVVPAAYVPNFYEGIGAGAVRRFGILSRGKKVDHALLSLLPGLLSAAIPQGDFKRLYLGVGAYIGRIWSYPAIEIDRMAECIPSEYREYFLTGIGKGYAAKCVCCPSAFSPAAKKEDALIYQKGLEMFIKENYPVDKGMSVNND
ncbi:MAG: hypothetical protein PHR44_00775 [Candidatus Omnitrophica bacterium]|nr:hypothetical protein [Candidatus Omnitrophota bacterium]